MEELDTPLKAIVTWFNEMDRVGRLRLESDEELRFGETSCPDFAPTVGMIVYVTAVGSHPLGGRKAVIVRQSNLSEVALRTAEANRIAQEAFRLAKETVKRREVLLPLLTDEAIAHRVRETLLDDPEEADHKMMYQLVEDLRTVGAPS